ncbi:MAG: thioredoxin family protein [Candidatus Omnitrophica bacterium]|nr:thioredoxin family protein [Candidatus Omnitrophota bacterium]
MNSIRIKGLLLMAVLLLIKPMVASSQEFGVDLSAPEFSLPDAEGKRQALSEHRGKFVVLEWVNPDCPFVRKHYEGNMQQLQERYTQQGVVWWSINSSAVGKQGHLTADTAKEFIKSKNVKATAVLLDADGKVGRFYQAKTTPYLVVINPEGAVIYAGAIDDKPTVDPADVPTATNYVAQALDEALVGKPVSLSQTRSYGCSVKY